MSGIGASRRVEPGSVRWTGLVGSALAARVALRAPKLDDEAHWAANTRRIQLAQLRRNIRLAARTEFGREHGFGRLSGIADGREFLRAYRSHVPIADWYAFKDRLARMREGGEPDLLWPGLVRDFAQTSGTTAGDKFIPVSREMLRSNFRASLDIFAHLSRFGVSLPELLCGKCLFIGGSSDVSENQHGVRTGDLSGLVTGLITWPLSEIYLPGKKIALLSDWTAKIEVMARAIWHEDVRFISGMPSWGLVLFRRVLEVAREHGVRADTLRELWPNLKVFVHGGVKYAPFEPRVRQLYSGSPEGDDIPVRFELYPASEGFVAMQDEPGGEGVQPPLRLIPDIGNFYEFVPLEEIDDAAARAFTADEVEPGQRYVVVMSTCAGLWRYILGDVVEFDSVPRASMEGKALLGPEIGPARLRIVGRHRHFINAFGENLIVEHIEHGVAAAARATGLVVGEFTAAPVYPGPGRQAGLELAVEFPEPWPDEWRLRAFRDEFDAAVKAINVDYTTKRSGDLGMGPPTITPLPLGAFHDWLRSRGKLGGQHKCPRCANHREIIEAVCGVAVGAG
ncbi:MAG TPA: GH3 auxin-responsive promoter family protein [Gemmatimonadales bacterium]|nr:GH3 auxin-responsive promoter family protein [Gemmatimonadales bacterium]